MAVHPVWSLAWRHTLAQPKRSLLTMAALTLGVLMLSSSLALSFGVQRFVLGQLTHLLPADMIEARAKGVDLGFLQMPAGGFLGGTGLSMQRIEALTKLDGVKAAYPKRDVALPLGAQGGAQLFGRALYTDLFVTALPQALVQNTGAQGFVDAAASQKVLADDAVIPLVVSPQLVALYNASVAPALGTPVLSAEHLVGFGFELVVGRSIMLGDRGARIRGTQRAQIVGVSPFAAPLGGTIPWHYAELLTAKFAPADVETPQDRITSIIVQAQSPRDIVRVTDSLTEQGLEVDATAKWVRHILWGATACFAAGGAMVFALAMSQTAFGLSVYIAERRRQWAILQAMGLSAKSLVALVLVQAAGMGAVGGAVGLVGACVVGRLADSTLHRVWPEGLLRPESLFVFSYELVLGCLAAAILASTLGAVWPATRAARRAVHLGLRD